MRIILQPYVTIPEASKLTGLSEYELRRYCDDGSIPHVWSKGVCYVDLPALWERLDAEQQGISENQFDAKELI